MYLLPDDFCKTLMKDALDLLVDSIRTRNVAYLPTCLLIHQPVSVDRSVLPRLQSATLRV